MRTLLAAFVVFTSFGYAQGSAGSADRLPGQTPGSPAKPDAVLVSRLDSVTWDPVRGELSWVVTVWDVAVSTQQPASRDRYLVHVADAVMEYQGETRPFDLGESRQLRKLMDIVSTYAVQSTVWWDRGGGQVIPLPQREEDTKEKPKTDDKDMKSKPPAKGAPVVLRGPIALAPSSPENVAADARVAKDLHN